MPSTRLIFLLIVLVILLTAVFTTQRRYIKSGSQYAKTRIYKVYDEKVGHGAPEINVLNSLHPIGQVDEELIKEAESAAVESTPPADVDVSSLPAPKSMSPPPLIQSGASPPYDEVGTPTKSNSPKQGFISSRPKAKQILSSLKPLASNNQAGAVSPVPTQSLPLVPDIQPLQGHLPLPQDNLHQSFYEIGIKHKSDKVTTHAYQQIYTKYLEPLRLKPLRFLEIGLDCDKTRGPGTSYRLWLDYLPNVQLYFIESDAACATTWAPSTHKATIYTGDATNVSFLAEVIAQSGGNFDVVIDDGGHTMEQQRTAFEMLMPSVRKGGVYFVEDLQTSFMEGVYGGGIGQWGTFVERIKVGLDGLMVKRRKGVWALVSGIDCMMEICGFTRE